MQKARLRFYRAAKIVFARALQLMGMSAPEVMERREKAETETAENDKGPAPKKIAELGDDAYWVSNRFGGILYVLKGDAFVSVGIGGTDDEATKREKSKILAQKTLQRL